jgi:hypothetical protein
MFRMSRSINFPVTHEEEDERMIFANSAGDAGNDEASSHIDLIFSPPVAAT